MAHVLIIEDEPGITLVLTEVLTEEGHIVLTAPNGSMGLCMLEQQKVKPDIIFVDLHMPGMSGKAVVETVRSIPEFNSIPVVIMTGSILTSEIMPPVGSYRDVLGKPFDLDDVITHVNNSEHSNCHKSICPKKATPAQLSPVAGLNT